MTQTGKAAAVIVAAGRGERAGAGGPKQYREVGGEVIIARTLRRFAEHPEIGRIIVAVHPDDREIFAGIAKRFGQRIETVLGGATRVINVSSANGLTASWITTNSGGWPASARRA